MGKTASSRPTKIAAGAIAALLLWLGACTPFTPEQQAAIDAYKAARCCGGGP